MSLSVPDFWKLLADSRLLVPRQVEQLSAKFGKLQHAGEPTAKTLAQWLVTQKALSRYQATVLLAGKAGPFHYGDFKVVSRLEQGRLAGCFRAQHTASGHPVQLKFLTGKYLSDARLWQAVVLATEPCLSLKSPHVQRYFQLVELPKFRFLVSEDLNGTALSERPAGERMPAAEVCRVARMAALGLAALHAANRVHGDLRPANVLLEATAKGPGNIKLLFEPHVPPSPQNLADSAPNSRLALMADYLAPELWTPARVPDVPSDIYALGCVLYELLAGVPPFTGGEVSQKLAGHTTQPIKPLESFGVSQPLAQLANHLLAKNPSVRIASAASVAEQLAAFVEPASLRLQPPPSKPTLHAFEQAIGLIESSPAAADAVAVGDTVQTSAKPQTASAIQLGLPAVAASSAAGQPLAIKIDAQAARKSRASEEGPQRRKKQKQHFLVIGLAALCLALIVAGGVVFWGMRNGESLVAQAPRSDVDSTVSPSSDNAASSKSVAATGEESSATKSDALPKTAPASGQQILPDDGQTLWASPTSGQPITLGCVPPEAQVFLIIRPAAMLAEEEGRRFLAAFGPQLLAMRKAVEAGSGLNFAEIEQLVLTLHNNDAKFPRAHFVIKPQEALSRDALLAKWGNPPPAKQHDETYYTGGKWSYYIPAADSERVFAMGEARDVKEVAERKGEPPPVFRDISRLRLQTDDQRHFTLLFYPQFLFDDDGEPLFAAERRKLKQPLEWLLGDQLQATSLSGHFGETFFFEARLLPSLDKEPFQLVDEMRGKFSQIPRSVEDYFVSLEPPPYWKKLALRYPGMVQELHGQLRLGVEHQQAILNAVLPPTAPHNLALGGELLVATTPGKAAVTAAAPQPSGPQTIAEALQLTSSFSFDSQSLEFAMRDLADEVKSNLKDAPFEFAIKILGDDLKLEGITRNQSIRDFKQENQTVADILTALVRKANPVTTVKDPAEKDQKLVWLIGPDPDDASKQALLITTRTAAIAKKYMLPAPFISNLK